MASLGLDKASPGAHGVGEMFSSARVFHGFLKTMKTMKIATRTRRNKSSVLSQFLIVSYMVST